MKTQSIIILNKKDISKILSKVIDINEWDIVFKTYCDEYISISDVHIEIYTRKDPKTIMDTINKIIEGE